MRRSPFAETLAHTFRESEESLRTAGVSFLVENGFLKEEDLDTWQRTASGVLLVGSSKALLTRLILKNENIKDQATGALRAASNCLNWLNLSQLLRLQLSNMDKSSQTTQIGNFLNCLQDSLHEQLSTNLLAKKNLLVVKDPVRGCDIESFTRVERKFVGRLLLLNLGALTASSVEGSTWFIFCGTEPPKTPKDCRGVYFSLPGIDLSLESKAQQIYILAHGNCQSQMNDIKQQSNWYYLVSCYSQIDELVRLSLSAHRNLMVKHGRATPQISKADGYNADNNIDVAGTPATTISSDDDACYSELGGEEASDLEGGGEEAKNEDLEVDEVLEYDEEVPTYFDADRNSYYYYGHKLVYDPNESSYYYHDANDGEYYYVDVETTQAIDNGVVPVWDSEVERYRYSKGDAKVTIEKAVESSLARSAPGRVMPESGIADDEPESIYFRKVEPEEVAGSSRRLKNSVNDFLSSASSMLTQGLEFVAGPSCLLNGRMGGLDDYARNGNGTYKVGNRRRVFNGLIKGTMELKSLSAVALMELSGDLQKLNLYQMLHIRLHAKNCSWEKSPLAHLKSFADKTDGLICEAFIKQLLAVTVENGYNTVLLPDGSDRHYMGQQALYILGATREIRGDIKERLCESSWWYVPYSANSAAGFNDGLFVHFPSLRLSTTKPGDGVDYIFKLVETQSQGMTTWNVLELGG